MDKFKKKLTSLGYKITKPRLEILFFLAKKSKPYSAQEIFKGIHNVNLVSVYRILSLFTELEIVNEEIFDKERKYCLATNLHHHLVCRKCGKIVSIRCNHDYNNKFKNFSDIKHKLVLSGICDQCKLK